MDGMRFVVAWHIHGTLSGDATLRYKMPCDATLVRVDTCGTADVHSSFTLGSSSNADAYIKASTPGHNATFVTHDRGDFDGDSGHDTAECPHIAKDTVLVVAFTHASASDVDFCMTFLEG